MARTTPERRPRAAHLGPERRRPLVLDAALELFVEHGYEGTSMAEIARVAGVTKPVVYACFASKDELFAALMGREEARVLETLRATLPPESDDPEQMLVGMFTAFLHAVEESPDVYRVIFLGEGGANAAVMRRVQRGRADQVAALADLARRWVGDEPQAQLLAHTAIGMSEAGAWMLLDGGHGWTADTLGAELGRMVARSLPAAGSAKLGM